jgi:hypothetical protein
MRAGIVRSREYRAGQGGTNNQTRSTEIADCHPPHDAGCPFDTAGCNPTPSAILGWPQAAGTAVASRTARGVSWMAGLLARRSQRNPSAFPKLPSGHVTGRFPLTVAGAAAALEVNPAPHSLLTFPVEQPSKAHMIQADLALRQRSSDGGPFCPSDTGIGWRQVR